MGQQSWRWTGAVLAGLMLAACGAPYQPGPSPLRRSVVERVSATIGPAAQPTAAPRKRSRPKPKTKDQQADPGTPLPADPADPGTDPADPADPGADPADPGGASDADALLQAGFAKLQALTSYKATVSIYDMRRDKTKAAGNRKLALSFKAPGRHRMDILETTNPIQNGMKLALTVGQPNAKIRGGGLLGVVSMTLPLSDDKLTTQNDWRLDHVVASGLASRLGQGYQAEIAGTTTVGGETVTVLKMTGPSASFEQAADYELLGFDARQMLRLWACYAKAEYGLPNNLLYQMTLDQVSPGANVPDDTFDF